MTIVTQKTFKNYDENSRRIKVYQAINAFNAFNANKPTQAILDR